MARQEKAPADHYQAGFDAASKGASRWSDGRPKYSEADMDAWDLGWKDAASGKAFGDKARLNSPEPTRPADIIAAQVTDLLGNDEVGIAALNKGGDVLTVRDVALAWGGNETLRVQHRNSDIANTLQHSVVSPIFREIFHGSFRLWHERQLATLCAPLADQVKDAEYEAKKRAKADAAARAEAEELRLRRERNKKNMRLAVVCVTVVAVVLAFLALAGCAPEPEQPATPESLRAGGIVDSEASYWADKLTTAQAGHVRKGWTL